MKSKYVWEKDFYEKKLSISDLVHDVQQDVIDDVMVKMAEKFGDREPTSNAWLPQLRVVNEVLSKIATNH